MGKGNLRFIDTPFDWKTEIYFKWLGRLKSTHICTTIQFE